MKETELKPCRCGTTKPVVSMDKLPTLSLHRWRCMIICSHFLCENEVIAFGFTKRGTYKKAIKAWNRRADNEQREAN